MVDGNIQVGRHAPLEPGRHCPAWAKGHVGHPQTGGRRGTGGVCEGDDVGKVDPHTLSEKAEFRSYGNSC